MLNHKVVYSTDDSLVTENQETTVDNSINIDQNIRLLDYFVTPKVSLNPNLHILHIALCQHTFNM